MNSSERQKLNEMLKDNKDVEDITDLIREQKYSEKIKLDVEKMIIFQNKHKSLSQSDKAAYDMLLKDECNFLSTTYPDIFIKLKDGTMDMSIMFKIIQIYREIEDGKIDQHDASYKIGSLLKEIYVDTVISTPQQEKQHKNVSYTQWAEQKKRIEQQIKK